MGACLEVSGELLRDVEFSRKTIRPFSEVTVKPDETDLAKVELHKNQIILVLPPLNRTFATKNQRQCQNKSFM